MNICLFSPEEIDSPLDLRDDRAKHLLTVLHKGVGDSFSAGIIDGASGTARIERIDPCDMTAPNGKSYKGGTLTFSFVPEGNGKPLYPLAMLIGFPRPIQLKRLLRDMAGLGVCSVYLCGTELVEKSYLKSTLYDEGECRKMLLEGTVQAAGTHVPRVAVCPDLASALSRLEEDSRDYERTVKLAMDNVRADDNLPVYLNGMRETFWWPKVLTVAAIGSERGWTDRERDFLEGEGFALLRMGSRVLRTETAATVAASLVLAAMGNLN